MIFRVVGYEDLAQVLGDAVIVQQMKPHAATVGADAAPTDAACLRGSQRFIKDRDLIVPAAAVSNGSIMTPICNSCI